MFSTRAYRHRVEARLCVPGAVASFGRRFAPTLIAALLLALVGCHAPGAPGDAATATGVPETAPRTSEELIELVQQAAGHLQREGGGALEDFNDADGPWRRSDVHLFVLSPAGRALHYSKAPHLVGQQIAGFTDTTDGRPFVHWQLAALDAEDGTSWAFYRWPRPQSIEPSWIATYSQRVTGRDGQAYVVGAGVFNLSPDATLLHELAAHAAGELRQRPDAARRELDDPHGRFAYRDVRVVAVDAEGRAHAGAGDAAIPPEVVTWLGQQAAEDGEAEERTLEIPPVAGGAGGHAVAKRVEVDERPLAVVALHTRGW